MDHPVMLAEAAACPVCGGGELNTLRRLRFDHPGDGGDFVDIRYERLWILFERLLPGERSRVFRVDRCAACGFIFTNPRFTHEAMAAKYEAIEELGSVKLRQAAYPPTGLDLRARALYEECEQARRNVAGARRWESVLDYGGAWGYMLEPFSRAGLRCCVVDYEDWAGNRPAQIEYLGRELADLPAEEHFDIILLLYTLEHAVEPVGMLKSLVAHLRPGGMLVVEVPLGCVDEYRRLVDPITHLNFFSEESLVRAFAEAGLGVVRVATGFQTHYGPGFFGITAVGSTGAPIRPPAPWSTRAQAGPALGLYYRLRGRAPGLVRRVRRALRRGR
ncbi:MAG TPA: class I SAM-dependent methyltransferase [Longimicrobium sp.]|nr:class I SAM-dependent methyltransferase [Longimicrobium sp.]